MSNISYAATYTVTEGGNNDNWNWAGTGSFRWAVEQANANPGADIIQFSIPSTANITGGWGALVTITDDLFINGISTSDNLSMNSSVAVTSSVNNVEITSVNFQTTNHSIIITGSSNIVRNCSFITTGALQNSIWISGGNGNLVKNCTFTASLLHAISIENGGGHTVDSCTVTGITDVGIIARGTGNNIIKNCSVSDGSHNGIGLIAGDNLVDSCLTFNNARAGIAVDNASGTASFNTISNCVVYGNNTNFWMNGGGPSAEQGGISSDGSSTTISNNYVYSNEANGIIIYRAAVGANNSTITNNVVGRDVLGAELGNGWNGIFVWRANGVTSSGNTVVNNGAGSSHSTYTMYENISGIRYQDVTSGTIDDNFIGTDAIKTAAGNSFDGITLHTNVSNLTITGNTICHNGLIPTAAYGKGGGIALRNTVSNCTIQQNFIGMHSDLSDGGNFDYGLSIELGFGNLVGGPLVSDRNNIGYSKNTGSSAVAPVDHGSGVWLVLAGNTNNEFYNNTISFNAQSGVLIERGANANIIGSLTAGNTINSNLNGILIKENAGGTTNRNSLRGNSFSCNTVEGITLEDNGNNLYGGIGGGKTITTNVNETRPTYVSGTAPVNAAVDIYAADLVCARACADTIAQGQTYVTTVSANGSGVWEFDFSSTPAITQANVIVMATDTAAGTGAQNSSEFSICATTCTAPQNTTITGNNICAGDSATLVANSTGINPNGTYQYYWYLGSVALGNEITPRNSTNDSDIVVKTAGTYIVVASETSDSSLCSTTSQQFTFTVNALPVVSVNNAGSICANATTTFTATSDSAAVSYLWSDQGTGTGNTITGSTAGNYVVQVTDNNGCVGSGTGALSVDPLPTINFNAPNPSFCEGGSVQVDAGTNAGMTLVWSPVQTPGGNQITVTIGGTYDITVTDPATGCVNTGSVTVTENPLPVITIGDSRFCKGDSVLFDAGNAGSTYVWSPNGETTQTINAPIQGTYSVTVTDPTTTCTDQASAYADENPDSSPALNLGEDDSLCYFKGESVEISTSVAAGLGGTLLWSNGITSDSSVTFSDTVTVWVMYTDTFNCVGADTLKIHNYCYVPPIDVPNIFIPGVCPTCNPTFTPIGEITPEDILNGHMEIYDRWGLKMHETDELIPEWDGTYNGRIVSSGVYFWIWIYKDVTQTDYKLNGFVEVLKKK